jgi:hypothetical protein
MKAKSKEKYSLNPFKENSEKVISNYFTFWMPANKERPFLLPLHFLPGS